MLKERGELRDALGWEEQRCGEVWQDSLFLPRDVRPVGAGHR